MHLDAGNLMPMRQIDVRTTASLKIRNPGHLCFFAGQVMEPVPLEIARI
jgi:hypothetical protein